MKSVILFLCIIASPFFNVQAFYLATHRKFTEIAIEEFFSCMQSEIWNKENKRGRKFFKDILIKENLKEDIRYLSKALQYSHFYNPNFSVNAEWLKLNRCSSDYRVQYIDHILKEYYLKEDTKTTPMFQDNICRANPFHIFFYIANLFPRKTLWTIKFELQDDILKIDPRYLALLGRVTHHLQDMASPTHVTPIMHPRLFKKPNKFFSHDAFEDYISRKIQLKYEKTQGLCDFKTTTPHSLFHLFNASAHRVLQSLREDIPIVVNNSPTIITWQKWYDTTRPPDHNGMRDYGPYGNTFGLTNFYDKESKAIRIDRKLYEAFAYTKYRQAVEDTKKAIYYFWMLTLESNF